MFQVYVIRNEQNGKIYIGQTINLTKRLKRHNGQLPSKRQSYTYRNKGNWELIYKEEFQTRSEAMKREKELKTYKGREFIKKYVQGL